MADCATYEEAVAAYEAGADLVGTTMNGYTPQTAGETGEPNFALVAQLARALPCPVIAEGRIHTPEQAAAPPYTEETVTMCAKVVWAEARGVQSKAEQAAVIWCILNRYDAGIYGSSIEISIHVPLAGHDRANRGVREPLPEADHREGRQNLH